MKRDVVAVWLAARDPRLPLGVKMVALAVAAYALSPIDLIPDFIPVLGLLDDLLIVPLGIWLVVRLTDPAIVAELRTAAADLASRPVSRVAAAVIVLLWIACAAGLYLALR